MLTKIPTGSFLLTLLFITQSAFGREMWLERNNRAVYLYPRRFGQEQPAVLQKLRDACPGEVCGNLAGQAVTPLLAGQPECTQQDMADAIIDASRQFDDATQAAMLEIAKEYRQAEKNTPPDFSTNPPTLRNSVFCQKAPKNPELDGLVQAQDPANDPDIFFDPATEKSVNKGDQANTFPFSDPTALNSHDMNVEISLVTASAEDATATAIAAHGSNSDCTAPAITVTVSATNAAAATLTNAITVTVGEPLKTGAPVPTATALPPDVDFGSCSTPEIEFGTGFDNRVETSFRPVDSTSFPHGSAQNIDIISQFICDSLTNTCDANQAAKDLCDTATAAGDSAPAGTGAQADKFNAVFGIITDFAAIPSVDDQGNIIPGTGAANGGGNANASATSSSGAASTSTRASSAAASSTAVAAGGGADFGSCSTPEIEFGDGFDGRTETSFQPADKNSFNHGSADNIDIISQFICGQLISACKANQAAEILCAEASAAASNATPPNSGAQADAFNAVFGIQSDFANIQPIDDQGRPDGNAGDTGAQQPPPVPAATVTRPNPATTPAPPATSAIKLADNSSNLQKFTGALGGVEAPAVTSLGDGKFGVEGTNAPFNDAPSAVARSCDIQNNQCADAANASGNKDGFTVQACNQQLSECKAAT